MMEHFYLKTLPRISRMLNGTIVLRNIEHGHSTTVKSTTGQLNLTVKPLKKATAAVAEFADDARSYSEFHLTPSVAIEPREYQQEALSAWRDNERRGSVILPTGSGKTFLAVQAIADAGVSTLIVVPTIDLMNQWHATLTNAFGDQLPDGVGVLGGGSHNVTNITVTTYDSAYRYINEYGDQFGLLVVDEVHHLPAPTYQQIPEMTIAPYTTRIDGNVRAC